MALAEPPPSPLPPPRLPNVVDCSSQKAARKLGLARAEVPRHPGDGSTPAEWKHDEAAAWKLLASAAAQDHQEAQVLLGNLNLQEDPTAAIQWYELAANPVPTDSGEERAPHADALFNLGQIFFDGVHVARDPRLATSYFQRAANGGDASAMYWLGYLHHHGSDECGISQDGAESLRLLSAAAGESRPCIVIGFVLRCTTALCSVERGCCRACMKCQGMGGARKCV